MKLFNGPLLRRRAAQFTVAREQLDKGSRIIANWAECDAEGGQGQFLIRIFEDCLA